MVSQFTITIKWDSKKPKSARIDSDIPKMETVALLMACALDTLNDLMVMTSEFRAREQQGQKAKDARSH